MPSNKNVQAMMAAIATDPSKLLGLVIGDCAIEPPGLYMPRGEAKPLPQIRLPAGMSPSPAPSARYVVVCMDFDAPYPILPFFGPVLHWIQADLVVVVSSSSSDAAGVATLEVAEDGGGPGACIAEYLSPNPPPGSAPHRYGFYLYEQPPGFDAARWMARAPGRQGKMGNWKRIRYGLDGWARKAGLGAIVAANYFTSN
ncbi:hypothetical protein MY11210_006537 [Beauveria gryllotalpidicola]